MKATNTLEIIGIGNVKTYPIKIESKEFDLCSKDLKSVKKVVAEKGTTTKYKYVDETGKEYQKDEIGRNINDNFFQKVERTKTIKSFKVVEKSNIIGNFIAEGYYIISGDNTSNMLLDEKIGDNKAIEFVYKSSSIGFKFRKAFIYKFQSQYIMAIGTGFIAQGLEKFTAQLQAIDTIQALKEVVVTAKADDIVIEI